MNAPAEITGHGRTPVADSIRSTLAIATRDGRRIATTCPLRLNVRPREEARELTGVVPTILGEGVHLRADDERPEEPAAAR
jgi:hypothetical protein